MLVWIRGGSVRTHRKSFVRFRLGAHTYCRMHPTDDRALLRQYVEARSDVAFAMLVARHINLVYSVAVRCVGDPHQAEEITQSVFILLANKAATLRHDKALSSWLFQTTRLTASNFIRSETRRHRRELEAHMRSQLNQPDGDLWPCIAPLLDEAVANLNDTDRRAILLRFYEGKSLHEVGAALEASEDAARKRVTRAIERLREFFAQRGITVGASGFAAILSANAVQAAPIALAASISTAAALAGTAIHPSIAIAVTKTIAMTTTQKTLATLGILACLGFATYEAYRSRSDRSELVQAERGVEKMNPPQVNAGPLQPALIRSKFDRERLPKTTSAPDLEKLNSDLRAALRNVPRSKVGTRAYPPDEVRRALLAFGPARKEAFAVILESIQDPDLEIRMRGVSTLGLLGMQPTSQSAPGGIVGDPAPEAKALCLQILSEGDAQLAPLALSSLRNIKMDASEIPELTKMLVKTENRQLLRYLPEAIAETIHSDPAGLAPVVSDLERLLEDPNPGVQLGAACALAQHEAAGNPRILATLLSGLKSTDTLGQLMALETLQRLGSVAEPALQAILDFGDSTTEESMKAVAFTTLGKIRNDLRSDFPEVDEMLGREERIAGWNTKFTSGDYTREDLLNALKEPMVATTAADKLGEMGPPARDAVPAMIAALAGRDQSARERIVEAIHRIDAQTEIPIVPFKTVAAASLAATLAAEAGTVQNPTTPLLALLEASRMGNSEWQTQQEVGELAATIARYDSAVYRIFAEKLVSLDPKLVSIIPKPLAK